MNILHSEKLRNAYSVGPLLYIPGLRKDIAERILRFSCISPLSVAICLEDTVSADMLDTAEENTAQQISALRSDAAGSGISLPKLFIRIREPERIDRMTRLLGDNMDIVTGFIIPKADDSVFEGYLPYIRSSDKAFMPIIENPSLMRPFGRAEKLHRLHDMINTVSDKILNIRVGGNDFCGCLGIRNTIDRTVYDLLPVASLLSDIAAEFTGEYAVSAPVWNYFGSDDDESWKSGMIREIKSDLDMGFIGKTVIHPSQIEVFNSTMKVSRSDYEDAKAILSPDDSGLLVMKSTGGNRMLEHNVHGRWAERILALADVYGITD